MGEQPAENAAGIRELIRRGEFLQALDTAAELVEAGAAPPEIRFMGVLALARAGATAQARRRYDEFGLAGLDLATLPGDLAGDIAVVAARLDKDEALARPEGEARSAWAARSAAGYAAAFDRFGSPYHAVNAATMWLVAGDEEAAHRLATTALGSIDARSDGYWDAVTRAEAALVVGDTERARRALEDAANSGDGMSADRATTLKQLKLICRLQGVDDAILTPIRNPSVVHYCGHRILPTGEEGPLPEDEVQRVRAELERVFDEIDVGFGFGSLAAGADILAAEALLDRQAELHVVLPFDKDEFIRTSVADAGYGWVERFEHCLAQAATVEVASPAEYLDDPVMFDYCARIAMGEAMLRATFLETEARQVAIWDGAPSPHDAGTATDVETWAGTGSPQTIIAARRGSPQAASPLPKDRRRVRAIVFADFAGFSSLSDAQRVRFHEQVMKPLGERIDGFRPWILAGNTWGDAIHLVFTDVSSAAECCLDLVSVFDAIDVERAGLSQLRGLRIAAHAAPVFEGWDPIARAHMYYGAGLTQAARIEPRTPEGEIYTTHAFAALAMLTGTDTFECQYVGTVATAKDYGRMPLYALRRRAAGAK